MGREKSIAALKDAMAHKAPDGLGAEAAERRSQGENLKAALFRLRVNLALRIRRPIEPGSGAAVGERRCLPRPRELTGRYQCAMDTSRRNPARSAE